MERPHTVLLDEQDAAELIDCLLVCAERLDETDYSDQGEAAVTRARAILSKIMERQA